VEVFEMDLEEYSEARNATQNNRHGPRKPVRILVAFGGDGKLPPEDASGPVELTIEATDSDLDFAPWLTDEWWAEVIQRWGDRPAAVHVAPAPAALLHPVLLYQLAMLRRVTPTWRLVGHGYVDDVVTDEAVTALAGSPYHEVRFTEQYRPGVPAPERRSWTVALEELFGRIRKEQMRIGAFTPILVRLPSGSGDAVAPDPQVAAEEVEPADSADSFQEAT
jgi:hypothetical protein